MDKSKKKILLKYLLLIILGVSITFNIYKQLEYSHLISQSQDKNYNFLSNISVKGENLADWLEEFLNLQNDMKDNGIKSDLDNSWRVVIGENNSITTYLGGISTVHMGEEATDWDLLQYSLFRVDEAIFSMTINFLENQSYSISSEEKDKLEAIVEVYRIIHQNTDDNSVNIEKILDEIKEPMSVIDNYYLETLERINYNK